MDPSGLGMMQPEGRPQQGKLKMQKDTCRRDKAVRPGNNAARGALPAKRAWKMSPGSVDEVELVKLKACTEGVAPLEPPGP